MSIFTYIKSHVVVVSTVTVVVVIVAILAGRKATEKALPPNMANESRVTLVSAATFRSNSLRVQAQGTIQSHSQADLRSQTSAPVAVVNASIGDTVYAGQVILELQNSDIRAQLAQSEASLVLAEGQYGSTRQSAIDKLKSSYLSADSVIHSQIDPLIMNTNSVAQPVLYSYVTDPMLGFKIKQERMDMDGMFKVWEPVIDALTATSSDLDIHNALALSQKDLTLVSNLLSDMSTVLNGAANNAMPSTLSTVNGYLTTVNAGRSTIDGANAALTTAATSITDGTSGSTPAQAQVQVAQAGVNNLKAQLAKTIITSPITGKISALPLRVGELASPGALLATVVGDTNNLEVKAYVSGDDLPRVRVGQTVSISGNGKGTVSNVAPSVDTSTKKAEVDIDVLDSAHSGLVIGDNVSVSIDTSNGASAPTAALSGQPLTYIVPIQDVKIIPGTAYVYTVDANSKIVQNEVTLGRIQGDFVEIVAGMNDAMNIVSPVYELDPGQVVQVQ